MKLATARPQAWFAVSSSLEIEGTVRLFALIRAGGQVDSAELLRHLDARLDQSAQGALRKWIFEPARREIPFRLAPWLAR